jgi:hypothetical protein
VFYGETGEEVRRHVRDLVPREWAAVVPLIVMMVWMGVYSQTFLPAVGKTTARVLDQTRVNVPFRVGIGHPGQAAPPAPQGLQDCKPLCTGTLVGQAVPPAQEAHNGR